MASGSQYVHAKKYGSGEVKLFAKNRKAEPQNIAFLYAVMDEYLKSEIPGKKVLDIGCGIGSWSYKVAESGAKSVDGFDIQEQMVQHAKQATSQFSMVNIRVGDVMNMPYDDNTFDVALSFYVTCALRLEACISHFKEMHRVLVPGGKAMMVCISKPAFERMFLKNGADRGMVEKEIESKLSSLKSYPLQDEINNEFKDLSDIIQAFFTIDNNNGRLQRITDVSTLTDGQAIWSTCQIMTFAAYYYDDQFFQEQIKAAGLELNKIENYYTEERRVAYNSTKPEIELDKTIIDTPPFVMYHLSKPPA